MALESTGERFLPGMEGAIEVEHLHRYILACELARGRDVLDVACGEGYGSNLLAGVARSVVGVDIADSAVAHARAQYTRQNLRFVQGDCALLPLEDASVDLVVSFETIEHHDQHEAMLAEIDRVLRPGGSLIISSPNKKTYSDTPDTHNKFHVKELDLDEFETLLRRTFSNVDLYGQRASLSSVMAPLRAVPAPYEHLRLTNEQLNAASASDASIYFVALASKAAILPQLPMSVFEVDRPHRLNVEIEPVMFETKMYWRSKWSEQCDGYTESRAISQMYAVDAFRHLIRLVFPEDVGPVTRVRLDIMNAAGVVDIHSLCIRDENRALIWRWAGDLTLMEKQVQLYCAPSTIADVHSTVISVSSDPWFELDLPDDVYACIRPRCALEIELTPYRLLDRLLAVMENIKQGGFESAQGTDTASSALRTHRLVRPRLAERLDIVRGLLQETITQRNRTIAQQNSQLSRLRDELLRAEAQLYLIRDLMVGGNEEDNYE